VFLKVGTEGEVLISVDNLFHIKGPWYLFTCTRAATRLQFQF